MPFMIDLIGSLLTGKLDLNLKRKPRQQNQLNIEVHIH